MKRLKDKRVLQYRAPYLSEEDLTEVVLERSQDKNDFLLQYLEHPKDKEKSSKALFAQRMYTREVTVRIRLRTVSIRCHQRVRS